MSAESITKEITGMSDAELRANLCTVDWRGRTFKQEALAELIRREREAARQETIQ